MVFYNRFPHQNYACSSCFPIRTISPAHRINQFLIMYLPPYAIYHISWILIIFRTLALWEKHTDMRLRCQKFAGRVRGCYFCISGAGPLGKHFDKLFKIKWKQVIVTVEIIWKITNERHHRTKRKWLRSCICRGNSEEIVLSLNHKTNGQKLF